jgi:hypothetical protein
METNTSVLAESTPHHKSAAQENQQTIHLIQASILQTYLDAALTRAGRGCAARLFMQRESLVRHKKPKLCLLVGADLSQSSKRL